jgi:hypothetical protein
VERGSAAHAGRQAAQFFGRSRVGHYTFIVADEYKLIVAVRERTTPGELLNDIDIGRGKETGDEHG